MKTITGLNAGIFWALDTVILGIALSVPPFDRTGAAVLAPFVSTFLHDLFSCLWMAFYTGIRKQFRTVFHALRTKSGKYILLGALAGGPVGMTGYVFSIQFLGASYTAMLTAIFPALGAVLSRIFLKERMSRRQIAGMALSLAGMVYLGYAPGGSVPDRFLPGLCCALMCVTGWAAEVVICAYGMRDPEVGHEQSLMLRQTTSTLFYGIVIMNVIGGWETVFEAVSAGAAGRIGLAALSGTFSYLCYYKTIHRVGPPRAMSFNITYCAWAILIELLLLHKVPAQKNILCGIIILTGALLTAAGQDRKGEKRNEKAGN